MNKGKRLFKAVAELQDSALILDGVEEMTDKEAMAVAIYSYECTLKLLAVLHKFITGQTKEESGFGGWIPKNEH